MNLIELAILFRAINLYAHQAHNMTKGQSFLEDHSFFGDIYSMADGFYDDLIERHIGTKDDKVNLSEIISKANSLLGKAGDKYYETIESAFKKSLKDIEILCASKEYSQGTKNMLQGQGDKIEVILYKIKQRLK